MSNACWDTTKKRRQTRKREATENYALDLFLLSQLSAWLSKSMYAACGNEFNSEIYEMIIEMIPCKQCCLNDTFKKRINSILSIFLIFIFIVSLSIFPPFTSHFLLPLSSLMVQHALLVVEPKSIEKCGL